MSFPGSEFLVLGDCIGWLDTCNFSVEETFSFTRRFECLSFKLGKLSGILLGPKNSQKEVSGFWFSVKFG
jgi:hypothetical protein